MMSWLEGTNYNASARPAAAPAKRTCAADVHYDALPVLTETAMYSIAVTILLRASIAAPHGNFGFIAEQCARFLQRTHLPGDLAARIASEMPNARVNTTTEKMP